MMRMFRIENNRDCFFQWDVNQRLIVDGLNEGDEVHFASDRDNDPNAAVLRVFAENGMLLVNVPNIFLQIDGALDVYGYVREEDSGYTEKHETFYVLKREKPADYVYTETEVLSYTSLDKRLTALEGEGLANAVADYLEKNPIEAGATAEEAEQIKQNAEDITALQKDKLSADDLDTAIDTALAKAKESGAFDGADGKDGVSVTHEWDGTVLKVTSASGTSSADLKGEKGDTGARGEQGIQGEPGTDGYTPVKGTDYFTEAEKQEIAEQAAALVEAPETAMQPLTFTGAVEVTYDGTEAVNVEIPAAVTDDHINDLINTALRVIENGTY